MSYPAQTSRYKRFDTYKVPHSTRGQVLALRFRTVTHEPEEDTEFTYVVKDGDEETFDRLSRLAYGTSLFWWVLAERNDLIRDPLSLSSGDVVHIPSFQTALSYF
jgi:hypothetical protein